MVDYFVISPYITILASQVKLSFPIAGNYTGRGIAGMMSRFTAPPLASTAHRITSLAYSDDGTEVLVSYSSEYIYLFNLRVGCFHVSIQSNERGGLQLGYSG